MSSQGRIAHGAIREDDRVHAFLIGESRSLCGAGQVAARLPGVFDVSSDRACGVCAAAVTATRAAEA